MSGPMHAAPVVVPVLLALLGVAFIGIAVVYFTNTAHQLPAFFPGHDTSAGANHHHHMRHGLAALVLGAISLIGAWMAAIRRPPS